MSWCRRDFRLARLVWDDGRPCVYFVECRLRVLGVPLWWSDTWTAPDNSRTSCAWNPLGQTTVDQMWEKVQECREKDAHLRAECVKEVVE